MPIAGLPARIRAATNSAAMPAAFVSISSIMVVLLRSSPHAAVAGEHGIGRGRPPGAGLVLLGPALLGPVLEDRVQDLPRPFHLGVAREQWRGGGGEGEGEPPLWLRGRPRGRSRRGGDHA